MFPSICPKFISKFMCKIKNSLLFLYLSMNETLYSNTEKKNWKMKNWKFSWVACITVQLVLWTIHSFSYILMPQSIFQATSKVTFLNSNNIHPFPKFETFNHKFVATTTVLWSTSGCPSPSFASQSRIHIP